MLDLLYWSEYVTLVVMLLTFVVIKEKGFFKSFVLTIFR